MQAIKDSKNKTEAITNINLLVINNECDHEVLLMSAYLAMPDSNIKNMCSTKSYEIHKKLKSFFNKIIDLRYIIRSIDDISEACDELFDFIIASFENKSIIDTISKIKDKFGITIDIYPGFASALLQLSEKNEYMWKLVNDERQHIRLYARAFAIRAYVFKWNNYESVLSHDQQIEYIDDVLLSKNGNAIYMMYKNPSISTSTDGENGALIKSRLQYHELKNKPVNIDELFKKMSTNERTYALELLMNQISHPSSSSSSTNA